MAAAQAGQLKTDVCTQAQIQKQKKSFPFELHLDIARGSMWR
jgi:hypothetical protein